MRHRWQDEYKKLKTFSKQQLKLLEEGPKKLSDAWALSVMYYDWKRLKENINKQHSFWGCYFFINISKTDRKDGF